MKPNFTSRERKTFSNTVMNTLGPIKIIVRQPAHAECQAQVLSSLMPTQCEFEECFKCGSLIPVERRNREKICVPCRRLRAKEHYRRDPAYYIAKARRNRRESVARSQELIVDYLSDHPCIDCGETDVRVLEFDHREPSTKRKAVAALVAEGYGIDMILIEIEKCDIRCANCHTIRTREQSGWFRSSVWRARRDSNSQPSDP